MNCKKLILALGLITLSRQGNPNTVSQQPINNQPLYQPPMMGGGMLPNVMGVGYYGGMFNPYMGGYGYWNGWDDWDDRDGGRRRRRRRHSRRRSRSKSNSTRS